MANPDTIIATDIQTVGTVANDTLDGGIKSTPTAFYTTLVGGGGNDLYFIDAVSTATVDKVIEFVGGGIDSVVLVNEWGSDNQTGYWNAAVTSYTMSDNVENLSLKGTPIFSTTTVTLQIDTTFQAMTIYGNALNNIIVTGTGADVLVAGLGADLMQGGGGADTYYVENIGDKVIEGSDPYFLTGAGNQVDTVYSMVSFTLAVAVEDLYLDTNSGNTTGTGNAQNNFINGGAGNNILAGGIGADTLWGGGGKDNLQGGDGNDYLVGDSTSVASHYLNGTSVTSAAPTVFGGDTLSGGTGNDTLIGTDGDTMLGDAGNDVLYGNFTAMNEGGFITTATPLEKILMNGGDGNDIFINFGLSDTIVGGLGIDTVFIDVGAVATTYTLSADVERGILSNAATTADILTGNTLANYLQGNAGNDQLIGLAGDDVLDGGTGSDRLLGGDGNDAYMVDSIGDQVVETSTAIGTGTGLPGDTVYSFITNYTLGVNVENLVLEEGTYAGGAGGAATNGKGNVLNNTIIGNRYGNLLEGMAGNDVLNGGMGADTLIGGSGNDTYFVDNSNDVIQELADFTTTPPGGLPTTVVGGVDTAFLVNQSSTGGAWSVGGDRFFNGTTYTMARNLENLDASAVTASGVDDTGTSLALTGNESNNKITGSMLNDTIDGGAGVDTMDGKAGNDVYVVSQLGDVASELGVGAMGGTDEVLYNASLGLGTFTMGANIENLTILGGSGKIIGNALNNVIVGNGADNVIDGGTGNNSLYGNFGNDSLIGGIGNDLLDGGNGNDTMQGGAGNDTYVVDSGDGVLLGFDKVVDGGGIDTVLSYVNSYTVGAGIENLTLMDNAFNGTGSLDNNTITGNANNNILSGMAGNDTLNGGVGADTMIGGAGDDTFNVDDAGDIVQEAVGGTGGVKDTVISTIDYSLVDTDGALTLGGGVENLTLAAGSGAVYATGNTLINTLTGNANNNIIDGGTGADIMVGGDGDDTYFVDNVGDKVTELPFVAPAPFSVNAGHADEIYATLAGGSTFNMSLNAVNVERLHLLDNLTINNNVNVVGNVSNNIIWGGKGNNNIDGGAGNDFITGGLGSDTLLGGAGDDVLDGDGLYQDAYEGEWLTATAAKDNMNGGEGNDIYYVNIGDGAGTVTGGIAQEDVVADSGLAGKDTVRLVGNTINEYTLETSVENLDASELGSGSLEALGTAVDNVFTGMASGAYFEVLQGGDGNDTFTLTPTNGAADTIRGAAEAGLGTVTATTADTGKSDVINAKVDTSNGAVVADIDIKGIEAITLDVSNMATANDFTWNFNNFDDASNFSQPLGSLTAPLVTITGGITLNPDTIATKVSGDITLTGLSVAQPVTYVLTNYDQTGVDTVLSFNDAGGSSDSVNLVLDNHIDGGLVAAGIETLYVVSTGNVLDGLSSGPDFMNVLDVSGVTKTIGGTMADIDVTGDSTVQLNSLANGQGEITLHDYAAQQFQMLAAAGGSSETLNLLNVETRLVTSNIGTLDMVITNTAGGIGSVIDAYSAALATTTNVQGSGNLTVNNFRGGTLNMSGTGQLNLNAVGGAALNLTATDGVVIANVGGTAQNDTYTFGTTLNNLDSVTDVGGTDTLTATVTGLDSHSTGQLHIDGVENITFTATTTSSIDAQFITGVSSVTASGGTAGQTFSIDNLSAATVTGAGTFAGNLDLNLTDGVDHTVTGGAGNDTIVSGNGNDTISISAGVVNVMAGAGDDAIEFTSNTLNSADTINGGDGFDTLTYTDTGVTNNLAKVTNIEYILFNVATTATEITANTLVAAGDVLNVDGSQLTTSLNWNGTAETDGSFFVYGSTGNDTIIGGAGNDTIMDFGGTDSITGGAGDDYITMTAASSDAINAGGDAGDTLDLSGASSNTVISFASLAGDQLTTLNGVGDANIQQGFSNLDASGATGGLTVTAAALGSFIETGSGADSITGGIGNDTLNGGTGTDTINGGAGDDTIYWNKATTDNLDGGTGTDTLVFNVTTGTNTTVDLTLLDHVAAIAGTQTGFENIDASVFTSARLTATAVATGSSIIGGNANDTLNGNIGADNLEGGAGNDALTGGAGLDTLTGGLGSDDYIFDTALVTGEFDTIVDFTSGDEIRLDHAIFTETTTISGSLSVSEFLAGDGLMSSNAAGAVFVYNTTTGDLYYDADANGSGTGMLVAHLDNAYSLAVTDLTII